MSNAEDVEDLQEQMYQLLAERKVLTNKYKGGKEMSDWDKTVLNNIDTLLGIILELRYKNLKKYGTQNS